MPDEVQTTQTTETTTPAAPATETYSAATGRTEVDDSTFLPENEAGAEGETEVILGHEEEPAQAAQTTTETTQTTETGKPTAAQETLLAGKYKTVDDLKSAFVQLGGDPNKYDTPQKLEEAYQVRQAEYNRFKQEQDDREYKAQMQTQEQQPAQETPEQIAQNIIGKLDFGKIENVQDLVTQLVPALVSAMPKPQQVDPGKLFEQFQTQQNERDEKTKALTQIEKDVPRLAMKVDEATGKQVPVDPTFRKAFAGFLLAGNYPRSILGLQTAMKDFLTIAQPAATQTTEQKASAAAAQETAGGQSNAQKSSNKDEADEILGEYAKNQAKYSV